MKKLLCCLALGLLLSMRLAAQEALPSNVAFVDTEAVIAQLPDTKQLEERLKATQTKLQTDFTAKQQRLQKEYTDYTSKAAGMSDTARARVENKLQEMSAEIQGFQQQAEETMENTRRLYMAPIYLKIGKAIDDVAAENGYAMVIPRMIGGMKFILYADEKKNVTSLVLQKLGVNPAAGPAVPPTKKN